MVSSICFALNAQDAGVDAIVAAGFEAGDITVVMNTTTLTLIPMVKKKFRFQLFAAVELLPERNVGNDDCRREVLQV